jgi:hypothetical protein
MVIGSVERVNEFLQSILVRLDFMVALGSTVLLTALCLPIGGIQLFLLGDSHWPKIVHKTERATLFIVSCYRTIVQVAADLLFERL